MADAMVTEEGQLRSPDMTTRPTGATVCHLVHSLGVGGAEILAARIGRRLSGAYRFLYVCLDGLGPLGEDLVREGFAVHVLTRRPGVDLRCVGRLAGLLRRMKVDVIHAHQYTPFSYAVLARLLCRRPAILFTEHGRWFPDFPRFKRIIANRLLLERRDEVVGVGEAVRQALIRNEGFPAPRVATIYNGIDLSDYSRIPDDRIPIRRKLGIDLDDFVLIQVARLDALKDHATAIRALAHVAENRSDVKLVLVGEGPEEKSIRQLSQDLGLEDQIRWLGLRTDVPRLLAAADLALLTSVSEGIPLTLIEAMAARLPIVATNVGGVGEVVENGRTGLLVSSRDAEALSQQILTLAGDRERCQRMGRLGFERVSNCFTEGQMHAGYLRLYDEMLRVRG